MEEFEVWVGVGSGKEVMMTTGIASYLGVPDHLGRQVGDLGS
jgi:hypothetical protein